MHSRIRALRRVRMPRGEPAPPTASWCRSRCSTSRSPDGVSWTRSAAWTSSPCWRRGRERLMSLTEALRSERGFTLAERLGGGAVIALVMAGLLVSLQAGQEAYLRGSNEVEATQSVRVAIERMAQELRGAGFCPTWPGAPPFTEITAQSATGFTI